MRRVLKPEAMPRVLQMLAAYPLGTLRAEDSTLEEWQRFHEGALSELFPGILDDDDLPTPGEVATGMAKLSQERSFERVIAALKDTPDSQLEQYRNELQWLAELMAAPHERATALMGPEDFIVFFKVRHMDQEGERNFKQWMGDLGQTQPPPSQLQRWLSTMRQLNTNPPSTPDR